MKPAKLLTLLWACLCLPSAAFAWNGEGHMVIAQIAYNHLSAEVKARCDSLIAVPLAYGNSSTSNFVTAACWADDYKNLLGSGIWHYIDIPFSLDGTSTNGVVPASFDIVQALNQCLATLQDSSAALTNQATSLRYLIHFVGDIQQPLHCSTAVSAAYPTGDGGGNSFRLYGTWTKLHYLWDDGGGYLTNAVNRPLDSASQSTLNTKVAAVEAVYPYTPNPGPLPNPMNWAKEGQGLARTVAYVGINSNTYPSSTYLATAQSQTVQCLAAGGHRLADLLTTLFPPKPVGLSCSPLNNGKVAFSWSTVAGKTYTVQWKSQLDDAAWTPLTNITASGSSASFSEPPGQTQRFYQVVQ